MYAIQNNVNLYESLHTHTHTLEMCIKATSRVKATYSDTYWTFKVLHGGHALYLAFTVIIININHSK